MDADKRVEMVTRLVAGLLASGHCVVRSNKDKTVREEDIVRIVVRAEMLLSEIEDSVEAFYGAE